MIPRTKESKGVQRRVIPRSQNKIAPRTTTENLLLILQRRIQKLLRFKSPITFMSGHAEVKPLIATAWLRE